MNYLAHQCGREVALESRFDAVRDLVQPALATRGYIAATSRGHDHGFANTKPCGIGPVCSRR